MRYRLIEFDDRGIETARPAELHDTSDAAKQAAESAYGSRLREHWFLVTADAWTVDEEHTGGSWRIEPE